MGIKSLIIGPQKFFNGMMEFVEENTGEKRYLYHSCFYIKETLSAKT